MSEINTGDSQPWQWPEETWRALVNQVRAGRRLVPKLWPNNAPCAIAFSFDSDHESNELRDGGKSIGRLAWGQSGSRVGIPRIEEILKRLDVPATFYVPAVIALLYPDEQRRLADGGHEIGIHGWIHELNTSVDGATERDLMMRAADVLESVVGVRAKGIRTPSWDFSPNTLSICMEMGLEYDSSLMADEDCYELELHGKPTGIVELPVEWIRDDAAYLITHRHGSLRPYTAPADVFDIFRRELKHALDHGGLFQLTMHPHVIGPRSRIWILEELIRIGRDGGAWFATHADVVAYVKGESGMSDPVISTQA